LKNIARQKWISSESLLAHADRIVVDHLALCIISTSSNARIFAMVVDASLVRWAVLVEHALWMAGQVGISVIQWLTHANSAAAQLIADSVGTAASCSTTVRPLLCN